MIALFDIFCSLSLGNIKDKKHEWWESKIFKLDIPNNFGEPSIIHGLVHLPIYYEKAKMF